jgi:hypothetical protein
MNQALNETGYGKFITGTIDWISQLLAYPEIKYDNFLLIGPLHLSRPHQFSR